MWRIMLVIVTIHLLQIISNGFCRFGAANRIHIQFIFVAETTDGAQLF